MLGAPGRARAAHIMQFRPIGVERPVHELAPEGAELGEGFGLSAAAVRRGDTGRKGCRSDRCHDAGPLFSLAAVAACDAFCGAENEFSPDLLKDSFICRDLGSHGVHPVFIRGERMENGFLRLPFGARAATSAAANFP